MCIRDRHTDHPKIHRLSVSRSDFEHFQLGGVYEIDYHDLKIKHYRLVEWYPLTNEEYLSLIEMRDVKFMDKVFSDRLMKENREYDPSNLYYSLEQARAILSYRSPRGKRFLQSLLCFFFYFLALIFPVAIYILVFWFLRSSENLRAIALPILALGTLPLLLTIMVTIYQYCELLLLNLPFTRFYLIRSYFLKWAGIKKSCYLEKTAFRRLLRTGIISLGIFIVALLVALFAF